MPAYDALLQMAASIAEVRAGTLAAIKDVDKKIKDKGSGGHREEEREEWLIELKCLKAKADSEDADVQRVLDRAFRVGSEAPLPLGCVGHTCTFAWAKHYGSPWRRAIAGVARKLETCWNGEKSERLKR